ncbi:glycosyltransferase [Agromyces agglutinans]|uniref:glycosyltransferase n=1 Tax=Agromyces agglutinans TaxID=2662258 RepID=UPI001C12C50D|nr:glycosyltransferase [Agromyces agglutinans]
MTLPPRRDSTVRSDTDPPTRGLVVMQSFRAPRRTTNPYITMLDAALSETPGLVHARFDWKRAILGRYDVFHWHWPEGKLHGTTWWKTVGKHALMLALLARHRFTRVVVVRTVHNLELPEVHPITRRLLEIVETTTDYRITLNVTTPVPAGAPSSLIRHGHYRDWYAPYPRAQRIPGRLGYFGGIRRYKSVGALVEAYADAIREDPTLSLRIAGRPSNTELARVLAERVDALPSAVLDLGFVEDPELVDLATSSQLVVLAYRFMHNSGSVLAALSLDRPVLVPRNEANEALAREVGAEWVCMYDGELGAPALHAAIAATASIPASAQPDLGLRGWARAGEEHLEAYRRALASSRRRANALVRVAEPETVA